MANIEAYFSLGKNFVKPIVLSGTEAASGIRQQTGKESGAESKEFLFLPAEMTLEIDCRLREKKGRRP